MLALLNRGSLIDPMIKTEIPINYIMKTLEKTPIKNSGSKVFILKAGTGTGKSTLLVTELYKRGKHIAVTEPQRITAEEIPYDIVKYYKDFKMGENIGYQTGLINRVPSKGIIFMTIGILRQHLLFMEPDQFMRYYSTIVIDEVHKHDIQTDITLRLLKQFLDKYYTMKDCPQLILMSGTLDKFKYMDYFPGATYFEVAGQTYHINEHWPENPIGNLNYKILEICETCEGDTLVFLPTRKIIDSIAVELEKKNKMVYKVTATNTENIKPLMIESKKSRIILATNTAETGLTIPFLKNIIDPGIVFNNYFNPVYNCKQLLMTPVTQSSAIQRRGRVGRKTEGNWYPLYTRETFNSFQVSQYPEIYTSDISFDILILIVANNFTKVEDKTVVNLVNFNIEEAQLINSPSSDSWVYSLNKLYTLGMITSDLNVTKLGYFASRLKKISVESISMIFAGLYHEVNLKKLIIIAASVQIKVSGETQYDEIIQCDFIRNLIIYELMEKQMKNANSLKDIEEWCELNSLDYELWMNVIELAYDLEFQLMKLGFKSQSDLPLVDSLKKDQLEAEVEIENIKKCIQHGYKLNFASWDSRRECYSNIMSNYRGQFIVTDSITYREVKGKMSFVLGNYVCKISNEIQL